MALKDVLGAPDKVETDSDVTAVHFRKWVGDVPGNIVLSKTTVTRTTSTWTAATKTACDSFKEVYTPPQGKTGSISIRQENKVVNSWSLVLVEESKVVVFEAAT